MEKKQSVLAKLPQIDEVLNNQRLFSFFEDTSRNLIKEAVREVIGEERDKIIKAEYEYSIDEDSIIDRIAKRIQEKKQYSLRRAVNATGVVLHTNLGRARLSSRACGNIVDAACGFSNLEYDVKKGIRGSRHNHIESIITKITGAEAAMVVNNNAAATMLCLSSIAEGKEVIVSRGELVEIGGSFRIPDIMSWSGARLVEVGTTNKTRINDYKAAVTEDTAALMKVHTSNYKIVGFTAEASLEDMVELGRIKKIPVIYDMGSGLMVDLKDYGIDEPTVGSSLKTGIDVILFSGDKLLGGPQAGIIAGRKSYIDKMKAHPLARVVRVDKMTIAALEATFRAYLDKKQALEEIPVLKMITAGREELREKAEAFCNMLEDSALYKPEVVETSEQVGGGSAPTVILSGYAVKLRSEVPAEKLERLMRNTDIPVIVRIVKDSIYIDMRTVSDIELSMVVQMLSDIEDIISNGGARK